MNRNRYRIDPADGRGLEDLIDAVNARDGQFESALRKAASLHQRPFDMQIDYLNRTPEELSLVVDPFTFDMDTDDLIVFSDQPPVIINAILEMAMFMRGFTTLIGVEAEWKVQVAIGAWRRVRESLKQQLGLPFIVGRIWAVSLNPEGVARFDVASFTMMVTLAGCPDVEVQFPDESAPSVIGAYRQLNRIFDVIGDSINLKDTALFNRRLHDAISLIEERIAPQDGLAGELSDFGDLI